jgi:hypothetical protein
LSKQEPAVAQRVIENLTGAFGPPTSGAEGQLVIDAERNVQLARIADALEALVRSGVGLKNGSAEFPVHVVVDEPR